MKQEINPQDTTRAHAFELWMSPVSFQFHLVQMDGAQGAQFFVNLQMEINKL